MNETIKYIYPKTMAGLFKRASGEEFHKYSYGHVMVIAGSREMPGAAILCSHAAMRSGCGVVSLFVPSDLHATTVIKLHSEIMVPEIHGRRRGHFVSKNYKTALKALDRVTTVCIGPGLSRNPSTINFVLNFIKQCTRPMVIDADALFALASMKDQGASLLNRLQTSVVLTPHTAELSRLIGLSVDEINHDRQGAVEIAARKFNCVVVLKGSATLVCAPQGTLYRNTSGNEALATAGSGDVLTGIIAARLALGFSSYDAAKSGVWIHGMIADMTVRDQKTNLGLVASDLIDGLPRAHAEAHALDSALLI